MPPWKAVAAVNAPVTWIATTSTTTNTGIWQNWITTAGTGGTLFVNYTVPQWQSWNNVYEETAEQRAAREERQRETDERNRVRAEQAAREIAEAKSRAEALLFSLLTDEQAVSYRERGFFEVRGSKGGRWRIRNRGQSGNVDLMPEIGEERDVTYCCHPPDRLPAADAHVAQMLHIVTDEDDFKARANVQYRRLVPAAA